MYKVLGVVEDKFLVSEDGGSKEIVSAEELVLGISYGQEFDGCEYGPKGLKVWFEGQEPYDVEVEVWKPVVYRRKYDGVLLTSDSYVVSNLGRVKSLERRDVIGRLVREKILSQTACARSGRNSAYRCVTLSFIDGGQRFLTHVLVCLAYLPNSNNLPVINHKDENPSNNSVYNLEWCTYAYNNTYGSRIERLVLTMSDSVRQYSYDGEFIGEFVTAVEAAKSCGSSAGLIRSCCYSRGRRSTGGFIWRYSSSDELFDLSKEDRAKAVSRKKPIYMNGIRQYSLSEDFIAEYASLKDAAKGSGATVSSICGCVRGWSKTSYGYLWRYIANDDLADRPENAKAIEEFRKKNGGAINGT